MAAPRPDIKFYLDPAEHAALKVFASHADKTLGELAEQIVSEWLQKRIHDASVLADELQRAGVIRYAQESAGTGRK